MDRSPPESSKNLELREQDKWLPIANVSRIMKNALPESAKVSKEAKECVQECVSEFVSFITSEASEKCSAEKRKTVNGEDILFAMTSLGFENYAEVLKIYLAKYREYQVLKQEREGERKTKGSNNNTNNGGGSSGSVGLEDDDEEDGNNVDDSASVKLEDSPNHIAGNPTSANITTNTAIQPTSNPPINATNTDPDQYTSYDETTYTATVPVPTSTDDPSIYEDYGQYTNVDMNQF